MKMFKDRILEEVKNGLLTGMLPTQSIEALDKLPPVAWNGKRMPYPLWCQVVSFFRDVYKARKSEAVVRLYYDDVKGWSVGVFPQTVSMASADEIKDDPDIPACNAEVFGVQIGTIHSHSSMGAFQSGKDLNDEKTVDGLHITLGKFDEAVIDIHSRVMLRGMEFPAPNLLEWIQGPPWTEKVPKACVEVLGGWSLSHDLPAVAVPKLWMDRVKEPSYGNFNCAGYGSARNSGSAQGSAFAPYKSPYFGNTPYPDQAALSATEEQLICDMLASYVRLHYPKSIEEALLEILEEVEAAVEEENRKDASLLTPCVACRGTGTSSRGGVCPVCRGFREAMNDEPKELIESYAN